MTYENHGFKWKCFVWKCFVESPAIAEGSLTTGMGEALGLVHLRLLLVYLVYARSAGACSVPWDVSVYAVFHIRIIIPFHFFFLMFTHKSWRGGLKPHPLPRQTTCLRTDEKNGAGPTHI